MSSPPHTDDDLSAGLGGLAKQVRGPQGESLAEFVQGLEPRYGRVWLALGLGWVALAASLAPALFADANASWAWRAAAALGSGLLIGYWIAYIALFLHEGAHYGLAGSKGMSDLITNLAVGLIVCQDVRRYRVVHWQHHIKLGRTDDSERSYFNALTPGFLFRTLSGLQVLIVLAARRKVQAKAKAKAETRDGFPLVTAAGIVLHLAFFAWLLSLSAYAAAAAWVMGLGAWFPFFGALRQLLEHRGDKASPEADYLAVPHGAFTRMFASGPIGSTFGGAGFRRHLLHHWLPQISCTNFDALEHFLMASDLQPLLTARRTTYCATFLLLLRRSLGKPV